MATVSHLITLRDLRVTARRYLPRILFDYIDGVAEDGLSYKTAKTSFQQYYWTPRVLRNTSKLDLSTYFVNGIWSLPFGIAPMGLAAAIAFDADLLFAEAAKRYHIPFLLSGSSLVPLEEIIKVNSESWFQIYLSDDHTKNCRLVERVAKAGFPVLVVTLDVPVPGNREADRRNRHRSPMRPTIRLLGDMLSHPKWMSRVLIPTLIHRGMPMFVNTPEAAVPLLGFGPSRLRKRSTLTWESLKELRRKWPGSLVLKGVIHLEDLRRAQDVGAQAVIVSTHGGRQLDSVVSPLSAIKTARDAGLKSTLAIDGAIHRGSEILKALGGGANFTFLGRPLLYAAAIGGIELVTEAIELLKDELTRTMELLGCCSIGELSDYILYDTRTV